MSNVLTQLVEELNTGTLKVVDLTQPLGPETPVIGLPPVFASSPGVTIEPISRYDEAGPGWYWNTLHLGEHTGTHFDAPVHWIIGARPAGQLLRHDSRAALCWPRLRDRCVGGGQPEPRFSAGAGAA